MSRLRATLCIAGILVGCDGGGGQNSIVDDDAASPFEDGGGTDEPNPAGDSGVDPGQSPAPDAGPDPIIGADGGVPVDIPWPDVPGNPEVGPGAPKPFTPETLPQDPSPGCVGVRYAKTSDRLYLEGPGSVCSPRDVAIILSRLKTPVPAGKGLYAVDELNGIYYLGSNLFITNGAKLEVRGISAGGDTNELRLKSLNSADPGAFVFVRAEHGEITLDHTRVTSWDDAAGGPDVEHETFGRAFIHVRSYLDADGVTPHESRMDIFYSDVGYLGFYAAESYGLTWKVIGPHTTASGQSLFDLVQVYGDIKNSEIHHNYFGVYTYGALGGIWDSNRLHHNIQYGFDPHDDSDDLTITNNAVHHNGNHGIICSRRCDGLRIANNISNANAGVGIFLHGYVTDSLVENNECNDNGNAGVALFDSHRNTIRNNQLLRNVYGVRVSVGSSNNVIEGNDIGDSKQYALYFYKGTDLPVEGDGRPKGNRFIGNNIHDGNQALKMSDADNNVFAGNTIQGFINRQLHVKDGNGNVFEDNVFPVVLLDDDLKPIFRVEGAMIPSTITIRRQGLMQLSVVGQGTAIVESADGQIYASLFPNGTEVSASGARLTVSNNSMANLTGEVNPVSLFITTAVPTARASIKTGAWAQNRAWTVTPEGPAAELAFRLGELLPGTCYQVKRESAILTTLTVDELGFIAFSDTPREAATTSYAISPVACQ
jgi:poly(beta-D-mannuronate) C5 epimerase